jgi:hypothetical protein
MMIEEIENRRSLRAWSEPFDGKLSYAKVRALKATLRSAFLTFCNRTPELASEYLRTIGRGKHNGDAERELLTFRGTLAQVVPEQLAKATADILTREDEDEGDGYRAGRREAFDFADHELYPPSPAQGPFFELLTQAPEHGLGLVRRLVDHAIRFYSDGRTPGTDSIVVEMTAGARSFTWPQSYSWSRDEGRNNGLTSALMALEAWAHGRIEAGDSVEKVLVDVVGPADSPACYLLVAVDLMISHWPKTREVAIPFLACPELLALDRRRQLNDSQEIPDIFGISVLKKEPKGRANLDSLKKRLSRRLSLEDLFLSLALDDNLEPRDHLRGLLTKAAARLGEPSKDATFEDPAFMALHALNRLDVKNWKQEMQQLPDGGSHMTYHYVLPPSEQRHLDGLMAEAQAGLSTSNLQLALAAAVDDGKRSSPKLAAAGVAWAQGPGATPVENEEREDEEWMRDQALVAGAMVAVRDGDDELFTRHAAWARDLLERTLLEDSDRRGAHPTALRHNRIATAFAGTAYLLCRQPTSDCLQSLLAAAARHYGSAALGLGAAVDSLASCDERWLRSILRIAFAGCVRPRHHWELPAEQKEAQSKRHQLEIDAALAAEMAWLGNTGPEPEWPNFPNEHRQPRRRLRIRPSAETDESTRPALPQPEKYVDYRSAAHWLRMLRPLFDVTKRGWLRELARRFASWTADANGLGLAPDEDLAHSPSEWNEVYFDLVTHCLSNSSAHEVDELALSPITQLPDEPFFDVTTTFLRSVDEIYFNNHGLEDAEAVRIRTVLAQRLMESSGWKWLEHRRPDLTIEVHIGPAIATLFFNSFTRITPTQCYLLPKGVDRLGTFLPVLTKLVETGASHFVALVTLNLLEVSPRAVYMPFLLQAGKVWMASYSDDAVFWVEQRFGARVCALIQKIRSEAPAIFAGEGGVRTEVEQLLGGMIRVGVAEATELERSLTVER